MTNAANGAPANAGKGRIYGVGGGARRGVGVMVYEPEIEFDEGGSAGLEILGVLTRTCNTKLILMHPRRAGRR